MSYVAVSQSYPYIWSLNVGNATDDVRVDVSDSFICGVPEGDSSWYASYMEFKERVDNVRLVCMWG